MPSDFDAAAVLPVGRRDDGGDASPEAGRRLGLLGSPKLEAPPDNGDPAPCGGGGDGDAVAAATDGTSPDTPGRRGETAAKGEKATRHKRKRGMKPRSQRNRKRARGGGRVCGRVGDRGGGDGNGDDDDDDDGLRGVQIEVLPLVPPSAAGGPSLPPPDGSGKAAAPAAATAKRIRVVRPYPFSFATFAKARWIGRAILDVYHEEFGSYPRSYYESAIQEGRILVSGRRVSCDYLIKGPDELSHTVHRHEPAVAVADDATPAGSADGDACRAAPLIRIVHESDAVIAVDKPSTLPVHPCGGYNLNSLFHLLAEQDPSLRGRIRAVHRLDRLTSGLTLIAKSAEMARNMGKCIMDREHCKKVYVARVRGRFPKDAPEGLRFRGVDGEPCKDGELVDRKDHPERGGDASSKAPGANKAGLGYWIDDGRGTIVPDASLKDVFEQRCSLERLLEDEADEHGPRGQAAGGCGDSAEERRGGVSSAPLWLHLACPCRVASPKNGVCEAGDFSRLEGTDSGKSVRPAQTSFAVLGYDASSDSTVVLCQPKTGRTHQIRLHLQFLGHSIANDPNYGGELWFADPTAAKACVEARKQMDEMDRLIKDSSTDDLAAGKVGCSEGAAPCPPVGATSTSMPASEEEVKFAADKRREEGESMEDFVKKTCVWCARSRGGDRTVLEFLVRSQGIWLHALQYSLLGPGGENMRFQTSLPEWSRVVGCTEAG